MTVVYSIFGFLRILSNFLLHIEVIDANGKPQRDVTVRSKYIPKPLQLAISSPTELMQGNYMETMTRELRIAGTVRFGPGVRDITVTRGKNEERP